MPSSLRLPAWALLAAAAVLLPAPAAPASAPGASVVLDQPDGFTDPLTGTGGHNTPGPSRAVSADGRYVAFMSRSDGLSAADDDRLENVYRKDRVSGDVVLVSVAPDGRGANADSAEPQISEDGNRIVFLSSATNLDPAAADGRRQVFVRDVTANSTVAASRADGPAGTATGAAMAAISGDGRVVAFTTVAPLDGADKNQRFDVYARRLATDETVLVSRPDGDGAPVGHAAYEPAVNRDGSRIAFATEAPLEGVDANLRSDVYRRTLTTKATDLISGREPDGRAGNGASELPAISPSGDAVAFVSRASDLDSQVIDDPDGRPDVFVAIGGDQRQLTPLPAGHPTRRSGSPSIAGDAGQVRVAFETILAASPTRTQIAVHTVATGQAEIVSRTAAQQPGNGENQMPSLAANGRVVAFATRASDLGAPAGGDYDDIVARDLHTGATDLVSAPAAGPLPEDLGEVDVRRQSGQLSPDGRYAAFAAGHDGLGAPGRGMHAFLRDARTGRTLLVDRADGPQGAPSSGARDVSASADGRIVAFVTEDPLVAADANARGDVYVRDTVAHTTRLVSHTATGAAGDDGSHEPVVSADGRRVAFWSYASDLGTGDTDHDADVYVRDLGTGELLLASRAAAPADSDAFGPTISGDGSIVAFTSSARNLDPADTDTAADVFVRDLDAGTTRLVSRRSDGSKAPVPSIRPAVSADGQIVAFQSGAPLQDDADTSDDIYVRDLAAGTTTLVSRASGPAGAKADGASTVPAISADGTAVAFRSSADNLGGKAEGAYVRRLADASTTSMGLGSPGGLSADGSCLMMTTDSPQLIRSSTDHERVLLLAVRESCELPAAPAVPSSGPDGPVAQRGAPLLSRLSLSRRRFAAGRGPAGRAAAAHRGTVVRFRLDRGAAVRLAIRQRVKGRWIPRGTLLRSGRAGGNRLAFSGRVGRRTLRPGRYRLVARARDAAGTSAPRRVSFRMVTGR